MKILKKTLLVGVAILVMPGLAWAEDDAVPQTGLVDIVVTAQKRSENLQTVPISVSAVTSAQLTSGNLTNLSDLNNSLPNVQINSYANSPDSAVFTIRGVGVTDADPYVGTTVSVVVDGVVVGVNSAALLNTFDIDRIEVLRGPQGTLFGANTTGGVINVITKQPTGTFGVSGNLSYGNYNEINLGGAVNFPIVEDKLAGKVSFFHLENDGTFRNSVNGGRLGQIGITNVRGYLKFTPSDVVDATFIGEYTRSRNGALTSVNISDSSHFFYVPGVTDTQGFKRTRGFGNEVGPNQSNRDTYSTTLTVNWSSPIGDIVSISNYREYKGGYYSDEDATAQPLFWQHRTFGQWQASQELRDTINPTDSLQLIIGGFALFQKYNIFQDLSLQGIAPGLGGRQTQDQKSRSLSTFAQAYLDITDRLRAQAGIRVTNDHVSATSTNASTFSSTGFFEYNQPVTPGTMIAPTGRKSWTNVGYKIGLDYKIAANSMLYGYFAHGFKSGGFVGRIVLPEDIGPFQPEYLDTVEIGLKSELLDRRLRANLSLFYNNYHDMQVVQTIVIQSGPNKGQNSSVIANAGSARTRGGELELVALPVDDLTLSASVAYLDAKYKDYATIFGGVPVNFAGNQLQNAPKWNVALSAMYKIDTGSGKLSLFGQYSYTSSRYTNYTDLPNERISGMSLVNGNMSWSPDSGKWTVGIYGRNIFNKKYYAQNFDVVGLQHFASLGAPRQYGVNFNFNF